MKISKETIQITKFVNSFLTSYASNFLTTSEHTIKSYKIALKLYFEFLDHQKISPSDLCMKYFETKWIENWLLWLKEDRGNSPNTCNIRLSSLKTFLNYIGKEDVSFLYLSQEAANIRSQKIIKKKVTGMTKSAVKTILEAPNLGTKIGRRDYTFLLLLYSTACRLDEILSLKLSDLQLNGPKPFLVVRGKGNKNRCAYLLPNVVNILKKYVDEFHKNQRKSDSLVFYSNYKYSFSKLTEAAIDKRIKMYAKIAHKKCEDVPVNAHAHQFRHAKATHWIEDGVNIIEVSFLLGHEQLETTMRYLDIPDSAKLMALETLESETDKIQEKKWKSMPKSLSELIGIN